MRAMVFVAYLIYAVFSVVLSVARQCGRKEESWYGGSYMGGWKEDVVMTIIAGGFWLVFFPTLIYLYGEDIFVWDGSAISVAAKVLFGLGFGLSLMGLCVPILVAGFILINPLRLIVLRMCGKEDKMPF